jgi:hypothetical protein
MAVEDADDLAVFFDTDEFAEAGTCGGSAVQVIRDREYLQAIGMVSGANPIALARASQFVGSWNGSSLIVISAEAVASTYVIRDKKPQDDGKIVMLELHDG